MLFQALVHSELLPHITFHTRFLPAMISHPPIPIERLSEHIEMLKAADNLKFSQEYESIEPGQQFTWDNSNLEVNKPKNRYANVIAYDHSRVILQPIDGVPGSDYINANYMDGYRKQNAYIATQVRSGNCCRKTWELLQEELVWSLTTSSRSLPPFVCALVIHFVLLFM